MSEIVSNLFNIESIEEETKNTDFINECEERISFEYKNLGRSFINEAKSILHTCRGYEGINFEEIELTAANFSVNHFNLMNCKYLIVMYDEAAAKYKYLTPTGKVFITSDIKLVSIIHNVPIPKKITYDYVPLINKETVISFLLISKLIYGIQDADPNIVLSKYLKPEFKMQNTNDEYAILYHIFNIYPYLETLISKYQYWQYIDLEQDVYAIYNKILKTTMLKDNIASTKEEAQEVLLKFNIPISECTSKERLIRYFRENKVVIFPSLNKYIIEQIDDNTSKEIIENLDKLILAKYIEEHKTLPLPSTTSKYGNIEKSLSISFNVSDKVIIRGKYEDMFFKIFSDVTYQKEFCNICNDTSLIKGLLVGKVEDEKLHLYSYYISNYLIARFMGYSSDEEVIQYFLTNLDTFLEFEDLQEIKKVFNKYLGNINNIIEDFNLVKCCNTTPKLLNHTQLDPLAISIIDKKRLIIKTLIKELDLYCNSFNTKNKEQINIIYFTDEEVYLVTDEGSFNTAFDTLTRIMPDIFNKFCPKVSATCKIETIK